MAVVEIWLLGADNFANGNSSAAESFPSSSSSSLSLPWWRIGICKYRFPKKNCFYWIFFIFLEQLINHCAGAATSSAPLTLKCCLSLKIKHNHQHLQTTSPPPTWSPLPSPTTSPPMQWVDGIVRTLRRLWRPKKRIWYKPSPPRPPSVELSNIFRSRVMTIYHALKLSNIFAKPFWRDTFYSGGQMVGGWY